MSHHTKEDRKCCDNPCKHCPYRLNDCPKDHPAPQPTSWEEIEKAAYEKWKKEHGDVTDVPEEDGVLGTAPEWWVRYYVESRLNPLVKNLMASNHSQLLTSIQEEVEGMKKQKPTEEEAETIMQKASIAVEAVKYHTHNAALDAVLSKIKKRAVPNEGKENV